MTYDHATDLHTAVRNITDNIHYKPGYRVAVEIDENDQVYIQVQARRLDIVTNEMGWGKGGLFYVSYTATEQQIVQATFGLFKAYEEHECRERFTYKGKRIYGPHISLEALLEIADRTTYR